MTRGSQHSITGLTVALLLGTAVACSSSSSEGGTAETGTVEIEGFAFGPDELAVDAGATVTWTNRDDTDHTVTQNGEILDSDPLAAGETYEVTFDEPGTYEYFCKFHPAMQATVTVRG